LEKYSIADVVREIHKEISKGIFVTCLGQFGADSYEIDLSFTSPVGDLKKNGEKKKVKRPTYPIFFWLCYTNYTYFFIWPNALIFLI
jgi:hypothetical protein